MFAVTFYSYKGGVGRTLAAANVAAYLAEQGLEVLLADFDLEAPGLTHLTELAPPGGGGHAGVVEYLADAWARKTSPDLEPYLYRPAVGGFEGRLAVMPAGNVASGSFGEALRRLREADFWRVAFDPKRESAGLDLFLDLKRGWEALGFDYAIVDSRTGFTDVGGVCTRLLPDALVVLFGLGEQGLDGVRKVVEQARGGTIWGDEIPVLLAASMLPAEEDELRARREAALPPALRPAAPDDENFFRLFLRPRLLLQEEVRHYRREEESPLALAYRRLFGRLRGLNRGDLPFRLQEALADPLIPRSDELAGLVEELMAGADGGGPKPAWWAGTLNDAAIALRRAPARDADARRRQVDLAVAGSRTLVTAAVKGTPGWAAGKNNLANALMELPAADAAERRRNLEEAVAAYRVALEAYRQDRYPVDWAMTQNNLANALVELPAADAAERRRNLKEAVAAYRADLEVYRKDRYPVEWAMTQNNLASALTGLPAADGEERRRRLEEALAAYQAALEVYRQDRDPVAWATTQNNLGNVLADLPTVDGEERRRHLEDAVAAYQAALEVRRKDRYPHDYAATCSNLALALRDLGDQKGAAEYAHEAWALRELLPDHGQGLAELRAALAGAKGARKAPRPRRDMADPTR